LRNNSKPHHGWHGLKATALLMALASYPCAADSPSETFGAASPFFLPSTLPFQAPPFDKIKDEDYQPAIEAGIAEQQLEMQKIADDPAAPTFENTLVPMERSGPLLARESAPSNAVAQANTTPALQAAKAAIEPKLAANADAIYLNAKLFARVRAIYQQRD